MTRSPSLPLPGRPWALLALAGLAAVSLAAGLFFGPMGLTPAEVWRALLAGLGLGPVPVEASAITVVVHIRLARLCLAFLVGSGLAVSGVVFQGLLRNPLAEPFTLGVAGGAAFGAAGAIALGLTGSIGPAGLGVLPLAALTGALLALGAVLALSRAAGGFGRETLVLAGIVVATFLSACISLVKALSEESVASIVFWIMGSFQGRGFAHVLLYLPYAALGGLLIAINARELDLLALGEDQAGQLGVNVGRARLALIVGASLLAGAAVAVSGVIGFVGLVVPHALRRLLGAAHPTLLAASALLGGAVLVWSDVAARTIPPGGTELPVGVVTALVGGPVFCLMLRRGRRGEP